MTNCRAPPKKVQAEPLASHGDISSNPRKQYANGEAGVREEPMLRKHPGGGASFQREADERPRIGEGGAWRYVDDRGVVSPVFNGGKN